MDATLLDIARSAARPKNLEELTRNLLVVLERLTGIESVYLTRYDAVGQTYEVVFARNTQPQNIDMPEGLALPFATAPGPAQGQRMREGDVRYSLLPGGHWPEDEAARSRAVNTYLIEPVRSAEGAVLGTLCAVSDRRVAVDQDMLLVLGLCARLVERQLAYDGLHRVPSPDVAAVTGATRDPLTGLADRHGLAARLDADLKAVARAGGRVRVGVVDLDESDAHTVRLSTDAGTETDIGSGHYGDYAPSQALLIAMAGRLVAALAPEEFVARTDGNTFIVVAREPERASTHAEKSFLARFGAATRGRFVLAPGAAAVAVDYTGATVGTAVSQIGDTPQSLLQRADEAMFETKQTNFAATQGAWEA